jgi:hypothetical protein
MNENPIQGITHKKNENFSEDGILTWITMRILSFPDIFGQHLQIGIREDKDLEERAGEDLRRA